MTAAAAETTAETAAETAATADEAAPAETAALNKEIAELKKALLRVHLDCDVVHLDTLCNLMQQQNLPESARLFILERAMSVKKVVSEGNAIYDAATDARNLDFPVRCIKNFIEHCKKLTEDEYDYPDLLTGNAPAPAHGSTSSCSTFPQQEPASAPVTLDRSDDNHRQMPPNGVRRPSQSKSCSEFPYNPYHSSRNGNPATPRPVGGPVSPGSAGVKPAEAKGKAKSPGSGGSSKLLELFLFPERKKRHHNSTS